ncbi:WD repeat and FYVE domain-containing protein 3-like isoform X2 [Ornithodoros turicata]|uniref:WD repeat and FYVE domain-containing protein 3-like isoform X2 n=1 Tax=Ornithodoros turicata TaxID=34597 RepID=UPI00313A0DF7
MNIMRKLLVGGHQGGGRGGGATEEGSSQSSSQHTALGLMHMHKLFAELTHPGHPLTQQEQEQRLYNMLPLFCKVFENSPAPDIVDKFSDVLAFSKLVSKLMVSEIRRRASNQSTESASSAIAKFLEIESTEEQSRGWMLLTSINLLASGGPQLVEVMTSSALPSTLVKCLYLFFDLPELKQPDHLEPHCEFTARERRILLQKVFVQVLVRLCSHAAPAEELARKDDLTLLFSAITTWCPPYNNVWRKSASEVLMTLSRHGLTSPVVNYIHSKGCVSLCVENVQRVQELSPLEVVEMFVTIFCFLKDSSEVSQVLLDDFRSCQGYVFLSEFLLRLEQNPSQEACEALRNLAVLMTSLTTCGYFELKPSQASTGSLFQIPGFTLPQPSGKGTSVRNIQAFQVLQTVFPKAQTTHLSSLLLDAISTIYHSDKANYFILESSHPLSHFSEKIHLKTAEIQEKFFRLLEFIVIELKFVPCKELISLSILLKTNSSVSCSIICLRTLANVLQFNAVFKDVYREVGLLEVLVTCLHRYATVLKEAFPDGEGEPVVKVSIPEEQQQMGCLVMEILTALLNGNSNNASVFRECGGARCSHNLVPYRLCRQQALGIVQQLVLSSGGDDDMGTLLGLMHTAMPLALDLKNHILKSLLFVLRESHRTRTVFRKVGGFVYVMSVLVSMEGCLADPPKEPWNTVEKRQIVSLLRTVFGTMTVAMRYEPANAKFFATEICQTSLADTVRLLGCFTNVTDVSPQGETAFSPTEENVFHSVFLGQSDGCSLDLNNIPARLVSAVMVMRLLYDMALDSFDKPIAATRLMTCPQTLHCAVQPSEANKKTDSTKGSPGNKKPGLATLNLSPPSPDPLIVHPGVVVAMMHLIPSIENGEEPQMEVTLQLYLAEVLRSLVRSERNQQVMCEAGLPGELLTKCKAGLEDETHPLHIPLQYMLERLAAQALEPRDLRTFLRLGSPLCCTTFASTENSNSKTLAKPFNRPANQRDGGPVPLTRIKTLVSMTTPRDCRLHGTLITPPFVEFEMAPEGFSCLYLCSVAPQSVSGPPMVGVSMVGGAPDNVIGGIGNGDRMFPPQPGLSFSTWISVEKFSDSHEDPHSVRLLTLVRNLHGRDDHLVCLVIQLSSRDKALLISTQEIPLPNINWEPEVREEGCVRIWTPELLQEGQWHHVVVVLNRAVLKNSSVSLYIDGQHVSTQKINYISQNPGGGAANLTTASSVYGFIGTPPQFRHPSRLVWKQGPCHLLEDVTSPQVVHQVYSLGPSYVGSMQAAVLTGTEPLSPMVNEEKVVFGLNATAVSVMTLAKIRRVYSKTDCKSIAKMLGMSSHENATPIRILHNSAAHLSGPARCIGGVLIGYLGARTFIPRPVALTLENIGGVAVLLGLVAMAQDVEGLYATVKALVCVVRSNRAAQQEMDRTKGYQTLAMLLKKKSSLLNSHILHLAFSLVGTVDSGRETTVIPNMTAFEDLLCNLEVWRDAPGDLQKSLYEHFHELITESSEQKANLKILREMEIITRLLMMLREPSLSTSTIRLLCNLLKTLLQNTNRSGDVLRFGQFMVSTLPSSSISEKHLNLKREMDASENAGSMDDTALLIHYVCLRNRCLHILHLMICQSTKPVNTMFCEELAHVLGFDWFLLFLQGHLHPTTIVLALQLLTVLLSHPPLMQKFREASSNGGWLTETDLVLQQRTTVFLGFNVAAANSKLGSGSIKAEVYQVPGFQQLQWLMCQHVAIADVHFLLLAMLMARPVSRIPCGMQFSLDNIWSFVFGVPPGQSVTTQGDINSELVVVLLAMVRTVLNQPAGKEACVDDHPVTMVQFLMYLYHNRADFATVCMGSDILCALTATLFPIWNGVQETHSPMGDFQILSSTDNVDGSCGLSKHPARKYIMDFLRVIIVDSLSLAFPTKQPPVTDLVLDAFPSQATLNQQKEFITEILSSVMEHLLAADVFLGEQAALPIAAGGKYSNIAPNVFYLTSCLVDKLWQGVYTRDPHEVLDFIIKLLSQVKRKGLNIQAESMYKSLNRALLFILSRPTESVADQMTKLECLQKMIIHRSLMVTTANCEADFIPCLCYCLLQLTADAQISMETVRRTTWHINPASFSDRSRNATDNRALSSSEEGTLLVAAAACKVWEIVYLAKKQVLEELCKVTLPSAEGSSGQIPDLQSLWNVLHETSCRSWMNFLDMERRSGYTKEVVQTQIQTVSQKLQKVTGGLTRLASRKIKREQTTRVPLSNLTFQEVDMWTQVHISIVQELVDLQVKRHQQNQLHLQKDVFEDWLQMESELTQERGLWGSPVGSPLDKWMLDMTEAGPCRMRKKMVKNDLFYIHYPYRPEADGGDNRALKYKVATSFDSREYYKHWRPDSLVESDSYSPDVASVVSEEWSQDGDNTEEREIGFQGLHSKLQVNRSVSEQDDDNESIDPSSDASEQEYSRKDDTPDNQCVLRLLEEGEKITHMFRCARVQGLDTYEGLLLFGKEYFYVVDGFTLLKTREIRDIDSLPANMHDPIIPNSSPKNKHQKRICSKFSYDDIRDVHKRRYLLQPIALEVFSADGRNYLLVFPRKVRNKVYARFLAVATAITDSAQESLAGQRRGANVESGASLLSNLIGETSVTQRWLRGEISNFQYLMHLNTLAGRSYNDLMQYPVFPWVLADYDSEELDLNDSATFRDFSKPMGAQTSDRLEQFKKRYREWDDPHGETPPYHYGTFYSSAMIVASYLVRMEPFTQHFLRLQGGHFDLADRMFHSIKDAWLSASKHNMADVKELIPEFFYLPEFLLNSNRFDLGAKQNGVQLDNIVLPAWAKGDPREFIRVHRMALESDYVSAHLHEWIDLIFGYKQQGPPAVEAVNVFHHLFYEGNVDIYNIDDPLKKNATIGFINNFGQIPKQLFKKPHPAKKLTNRTSVVDPGPIMPGLSYCHDKLFFHNLDNLKPSLHPIKELKGPVGQIIQHEKSVLAVEQNKVLIGPLYNRYVAWGFADYSLRIGPYENDRASFVWEDVPSGEILCCSCPDSKIIITAGTSSVVTVWHYDKKKLTLKRNLHGHTEPVTCLAASRPYNIIVSGSRDYTCIVWDLSRLVIVRQLRGHSAPVAAVAINDLMGDIATCAGTSITLWTINGQEVASVNTATGRSDRLQQILCVAFSQLNEWDNQNVIMTGSSDGVVRMWSADYIQIPVEDKKETSSLAPADVTSPEKAPSNAHISNPGSPDQQETMKEKIVRKLSAVDTEDVDSFRVQGAPSVLVKCDSESSLSDEDADSVKSFGKGRTSPPSASTANAKWRQDERRPSLLQHSQTVVGLLNTQNPKAALEEHQVTKSTLTIPQHSKDSQESPDDAKSATLRMSKSENSLTDSFVMITEADVVDADKHAEMRRAGWRRNVLREGFRWTCQLVFRSKLTMHTAFDRKDNTEPAAVTALAVSKDHKTVYVGDARGRIFTWSVTEHPGRAIADHWVRDEGGDSCLACGVRFSFSERRHHCRNCGQLFCSRCSRFESEISRLRILKPVRVCQTCYTSLRSTGDT